LQTGQRIGRYVIESSLGRGGMGEVYLARDLELHRRIALKLLPAELAEDTERGARFRREARSLAAVNHPGIVTLHSIEDFEGSPVLTMEYVEGETLDRTIAARGMTLPEFLAIAVPLADAVSAAHERGIVHRDLKPTNVMVVGGARVKVLDFGLATAAVLGVDPDPSLATATELTVQGAILGTAGYMSPEQIRGDPVDSRTDIFSLGVVFYQMLTGERPFRADTAIELLSSILRDEPVAVTEVRSELPPDLGRIVRRCLEKKPSSRYPSVVELLNDLRALPSEATASPPAPARDEAPTRQADDGFWVAVMPFRCRGADPALEALAEDFAEEIVTGLSRFSYLRVVGHGSTQRYADRTVDVRTVGAELGARYVMEGSVRRAGSSVRIAVRLVETGHGSHLWAETYDRPFDPDRSFELIDDVVPRIVSTSADMHGVLTHTMSEALRNRDLDDLSPYEAVLRSFGYVERLTAEEHLQVRTLMERTTERAPTNADALAMLSFVYAEEFKHGFNLRPGALDRALEAARSAVAAGPSNNLAYHVLAQALFFRRELPAFRNAARRAVDLNPMDGGTIAFMGILMGYAGDWEHGPALAARAMELNPNHPGWYHFSAFFDAYRRRDYETALDVALRINLPSYFYYHGALAMAAGQLGKLDVARRALDELLIQKPDFAETATDEWAKWLGHGEMLDHVLDGLRKAGLSIFTG
jgi:TolB-like protein